MKNDSDRFDPKLQQYLDGELPAEAVDSAELSDAERLLEAAAAYSDGLDVPGPEIDRAVMSSIRVRGQEEHQSLWNWLFKPQVYRIRPALVVAVVIVLVAFGTVGGTLRNRTQFAIESSADQSEILVRFELVAPTANTVSLSGSFNEWQPDGVQLTRNPETGIWSGTIPLRPGEHQYMFVIDGAEWIPDPDAHAQVDDGFGQTNSVIVVGPRGVIRS